MKHAIVTGATGFIGVHLITELLANGVAVTALCRRESPNINRLPPEARIVYDTNELKNADVFFHLAWEQASGAGRADALLQSRNVGLTLDAIHAARRLSAKFVALGTVYEHFSEQVMQSGRFGSSDFYILSKKSAHDMGNQLAYQLGVDFVWCRICHPIGRYIKTEQLMAYTVSNLLGGTPPLFGPAETLYDMVAVEDVARGLYLIGKQENRSREYFIGSGSPKILRAYFEEARRILNVDTPLLIGQRPDDGLRFAKEWFDITPLASETGYKPRVGFGEAVKNVAGWVETK